MSERLQNFIDGAWSPSTAEQTLNVVNPASTAVLAEVPLSPAADVNKAAGLRGACLCWMAAHTGWRSDSASLQAEERCLKRIATTWRSTITDECGKTLGESKGEMQRAIENVETACGMPMMMQGTNMRGHCGGH